MSKYNAEMCLLWGFVGVSCVGLFGYLSIDMFVAGYYDLMLFGIILFLLFGAWNLFNFMRFYTKGKKEDSK